MAVQSSKYEVFKIRSSNGEREVDLIDGPFAGGARIVNIYFYEKLLVLLVLEMQFLKKVMKKHQVLYMNFFHLRLVVKF